MVDVLEVEGFEIESTYDSWRLLLLTQVSFSGINKVGPAQNQRVTEVLLNKVSFVYLINTEALRLYPSSKITTTVTGCHFATPQGPHNSDNIITSS